MKRKSWLWVWCVVTPGMMLGVIGCGGGREFAGDGASSDIGNVSVRLARKPGGGTAPSLVGTWDGTWTSSIPSGGTAPDSGTVHLVVTQQSGNTFQATITVYDPSRGESITDRIDKGSIKGSKVSFKGKRPLQRESVTYTLDVSFSGTVTGAEAQGNYSGKLIKGKGKGNVSQQDNGTWVMRKVSG